MRATFKFDLDQVFPQQVLVDETGATALEHLITPLWGATGSDASGRPVELGLLAGALVNERDIGRGLFTPDVPWPDGPGSPDEFVFLSRLPQALSTRAEMMERYDTPARDGRSRCLERVHVTGGTNGILIGALRRHSCTTVTPWTTWSEGAGRISRRRAYGPRKHGSWPRPLESRSGSSLGRSVARCRHIAQRSGLARGCVADDAERPVRFEHHGVDELD